MVVGICQTDVVMGDTRYNLIAAEDYIQHCSNKGADVAFFPELSMTGFGVEPDKVVEDGDNGITVKKMSEYAVRYNIALGFGYTSSESGKYSNRYVVVDRTGRIVSDYAKIHPFSYDGEDKQYVRGNKLSRFKLEEFNASTFVCYDLRFPEIFQAASDSAELIVVAANWPAARRNDWELLIRARALENQAYVIGVNRVGDGNGTYYSGDSILADPKGNVVDVLSDRAGTMIDEIDLQTVLEYRESFPVKKDRRPDLYRNIY